MREGRHLELRTDIVNYHFENWRLVHNIVTDIRRCPLSGNVYDVQAGGPDFVHARLSAYHNHLIRDQRDSLYFFIGGEEVQLHKANFGTQSCQGSEFVCGAP
jgi:hypothetical protein